MNLFQQFRVVIHLKQIVSELRRSNDIADRANTLAETALELQYPAWAKSGGLSRKRRLGPPKLAVLGTMDSKAIEKRWYEEHPEMIDEDI